MKKMLVWETLSLVSGGQKMTLTIMDMLKDEYCFHCLIPEKGALSDELNSRSIPYTLLGNQTMPTGIKGKSVVFRYAWLSLKAIVKALKVIRKVKPDIIYAPGPAALPWSAFCGSLTHKPVIWHLHHIFLDGATKKLLNICGGWKSVKLIISVSDCVGDQITNTVASAKKETVYNPVDFERFTSGNGQKILNELKIDRNNNLLIGQIALLQPLKCQTLVIKVAAALKEKGYKITVLFAGRARDEDSLYVSQLHKLAFDYGMENEVIFMGQRSDVPDILKAVDLIMIPSSLEGFPLAGLEACAAGTPVVAADVGGSEELIRVSKAGICFKYDNITAATEAVELLVNSNELLIYKQNCLSFASSCSMRNYSRRIHDAFRI